MARFRLSAHCAFHTTVKSPLGSPSRIATPRHSPSRTAPTTERKRRLKRLLHHCLREMSRTREIEIYSAIIKLDSSAPYFVQSRTLAPLARAHNRSAVIGCDPK